MLDSVEAAVQWATKMTWKAVAPVVYLVEGFYEKGVKVLAEELEFYLPCWQPSETLPKWNITILPN
ncbi:hypothetical protein ACN4EG_25830 [Alkalinema pantanalense CENA528]|uniref:hypothetical protein n=1 Tax=Alkalinema pantanalense TaxID=1620705 RepID=UPI003D6EE881